MITKIKYANQLYMGLIIFLCAFILNWVQGINTSDECWFLYLMQRLNEGDILYHDFFFGVTPLSAYLAFFFTHLLGTELFVLKLIVAGCEAITILVLLNIAKQLKLSRRFNIWFFLSFLVLASTNIESVYTALANMLFSICFSYTLAWQDNFNIKPKLLWASIFAGLSFSAKQNIGIYIITILYILIFIQSWEKQRLNWRYFINLLLLTTACFLIPIIISLIPVMLTGSFEKFIEYGFINKRNYLHYARISYFDGLLSIWTLGKNFLSYPSISLLTQWFQSLFFLLPCVVLVVVIFNFFINKISLRYLTVILFITASFLSVFPRADFVHLTVSIPYLLLGLGYSFNNLFLIFTNNRKKIIQFFINFFAWSWLILGINIQLTSFIMIARNESYTLSVLPHLHGMLISAPNQAEIIKIIPQLRDAKKSLFILSPLASFYYLVTDIKNPTAYDYPLNTAFGLNGQANVISSIAQKMINAVCLESYDWILRPAQLEDYVRMHMQKKQKIGGCTLYETFST